MATQVKHRRGTNAEILAGTPAIGELWFNTTDNTIHMGDGVTKGGVKQTPIFDSVAAMKTNNLVSGMLVKTKSYYADSASDTTGAATYKIVTSAEFGGTPDEYGNHTLVNGNVAKLVLDGNIVDVTKFGAIADDTTPCTTPFEKAFLYCEENQAIPFIPNGNYFIDGNLTLPQYGMLGESRKTTLLRVDNAVVGNVLQYNSLEAWATGQGKLSEFTIYTERASTANIIGISTPSRGFEVSNVTVQCGSGACFELEYSFYINFYNIVTTGPFVGTLSTTESDRHVGVAYKIKDREANNLSFFKCDARDIGQVYRTANQNVFEGSNNILFTECVFERIGDCVMDLSGVWTTFESCYFEALDRNQLINTGSPTDDTHTCLFYGGAGNPIFRNCLINLGGARLNDPDYRIFSWILGDVTFDTCGGLALDPSYQGVFQRNVTFSTNGLLKVNNCRGLAEWSYSAYQHFRQQFHNLGRNAPSGKEAYIYTHPVVDDHYAKHRLAWDCAVSDGVFSFNTQPICLVDGYTDKAVTLVEIKLRVQRCMPSLGTEAWEDLDIRFLIDQNMPSTITPTVSSSGVNGDAANGFKSGSVAPLIQVWRLTADRTDPNVAYNFAYQVGIVGEAGGSPAKSLSNSVEVTIKAISLNGDSSYSDYGIYQQGQTFVSPP